MGAAFRTRCCGRLAIDTTFIIWNMVGNLTCEAHADVNHARTDNVSTLLFIAAQEGNLDVVCCLASEAHTNVNQARTDNGATPLSSLPRKAIWMWFIVCFGNESAKCTVLALRRVVSFSFSMAVLMVLMALPWRGRNDWLVPSFQ